MIQLLNGNALHLPLASNSVQTCVTSPPYWGLRDYGSDGQLGLEQTPEQYVENMVQVFREVRRVLRDDGTLWLNLGDSYANTGLADSSKVGGFTGDRIRRGVKGTMDSRPRTIPIGLKPKDLVGIPWRVAFALQADGWWLRQDIIWHKPNPMPESVRDRCTKAHEYMFLLSKSGRYYYDADAIKETGTYTPGTTRRAFTTPRAQAMGREPSGNEVDGWVTESGYRNKRSVWTVATHSYSGAHYATFPPKLIEPCILAGAPEGGIVLDPFVGSGTTLQVARQHRRKGVGLDLSFRYLKDNARTRLNLAQMDAWEKGAKPVDDVTDLPLMGLLP